jgi:thymidylate kinase
MERIRGTYVCIEGLDGSGKSTLFEALKERLVAVEFPFATVCPTRAVRPNGWLERWYRLSKPMQRSPSIRAIIYAIRSAQAAKATKWDSPLILGDRSVVTSYVTRWRRWFDSALLSRWLVDVLESRMPAPDHIIFLELPAPLLRQRLVDRALPLEIDETAERAEQMRLAYEELRTKQLIPRLKTTVWHLIDATPPSTEVAASAWELLAEIVPGLADGPGTGITS